MPLMSKAFKGLSRILLTAVAAIAVIPGAMALTVVADSPGSLASALAGVPSDTRELVLEGTVYSSELAVLRDSLPMLEAIDMRGLIVRPAQIPPYAFAAMPLANVSLPDDITVIGEGAFAAIPAKELTLPARLDSIAPYAFAHSALVSLTLPDGLRAIGRNAFGDCVSLSDISGGKGVVTVGESAFHGAPLRRLDLSHCESLRSVGARAFEGCSSLEEVSLPATGSLTLGEGLFLGCGALTGIDASGIEHVPALMIAGAPDAALSGILTEGVRTIGAYAMSGNRASGIVLPSTLDSIGDHGMERMHELASIDASALRLVPALGEDVWDEVDRPAVKLGVAEDMADSFAAASQWQEFDISLSTGAVDGIEQDTDGIVLWFDGTVLKVSAPRDIMKIEAVSIDGIMLADMKPGVPQAQIDACHWPCRVCVVAVTLVGGTKSTYTLSR
ncbi:leucine-rich repeat domain-containing protein [Muribaculum sp.]|uniref:leucine-rich repeat domain-containing protein n=1 Tax=Muribaculum sp. TaxID=1918611 RepID=UPI00262C7A3C|nr:leucine-rich repeat domain-containing protein [Muribaculum sp.]